ncbi:MAG: Mpo1-like protein [Planctomycetaceae bacterium]
MINRFVKNYVARHQHGANQLLHVLGVPLTFVVSVVFVSQRQFGVAAACFVGGYLLQFLGHAIEGNDAGEVVLIKKLLGKPYTEFAPKRDG